MKMHMFDIKELTEFRFNHSMLPKMIAREEKSTALSRKEGVKKR
ncbi:MAG: hypothetical protein RIB15_06695 [Gracilimonas sp.]